MDNKISYTNKDYNTLYESLVSLAQELAPNWNPQSDTDPGVTLIKLMASLGDMLSYNLDKAALELYPSTVTQWKNAYDIFRLVGYKMKWYRAGVSVVTMSPKVVEGEDFTPFTIRGYSTIYNKQKSVSAVILSPRYISATVPFQIEAYEGRVAEESYSSSSLVNRKLYIANDQIAEGSLSVSLNIGEEGTPVEVVDNIDVESTAIPYCELLVDNNKHPYIKFNEAIDDQIKDNENLLITVKYVVTNGSQSTLGINSFVGGFIDDGSDKVTIDSNTSATGSDPETPSEAYKASRVYINTVNTLITTKDYTNAVERLVDISKATVTDLQSDPYHLVGNNPVKKLFKADKYDSYEYYSDNDLYPFAQGYNLLGYCVKSDWKNPDPGIDLSDISKYKSINQNLRLVIAGTPSISEAVPGIIFGEWEPEGVIYTKVKISTNDMAQLINNVLTALKERFSPSNCQFGQYIEYNDVIDCIVNSDSNISTVILNNITYNYTSQYNSNKGSLINRIIDQYIISIKNGTYNYYKEYDKYGNPLIYSGINFDSKYFNTRLTNALDDSEMNRDNRSNPYYADPGDILYRALIYDKDNKSFKEVASPYHNLAIPKIIVDPDNPNNSKLRVDSSCVNY